MIINDIVTCLRNNKYLVDTQYVNKEVPRHLVVNLASYKPNLETSTSYTPEIEVNIIFYMVDGDLAIAQIKDIIEKVHSGVLVNYHHMSFTDIDIQPTGNDLQIVMVIKYRDVIDLG